MVSETLTPDAARIREDVFVREQGFEVEFDEKDADAYHMLVYDDDVPIAVCRFMPGEDGVCTIGRLAVVPGFRGRSIGRAMLAEAEREVSDMGQRRMVLSAQVRARGFYEACGYTAYGCEYRDEWCPHIMMGKDLRSRSGRRSGTAPSGGSRRIWGTSRSARCRAPGSVCASRPGHRPRCSDRSRRRP